MVEQFAADYSASEQSLKGTEDNQSSIHYPTVFLYIGDEAGQAIIPMMKSNGLRWANHAGVLYGHVSSAACDREGVATNLFEIPLGDSFSGRGDRRSVRAEIGKSFSQPGRHLAELNTALRKMSDRIGDYGRMYASFDRLHLAVITRGDDPMNIVAPDIALLAKSIFGSLFKSVQMDLFLLLQEREQSESFGYASATGISFLREMERFQQSDFSYKAPLQLTGDGLGIAVQHRSAPLFDMVYLLSDRNERGMTSSGGMEHNYEIISRIMLLKNRSKGEGDTPYSGELYNNTSFRNSLVTESGKPAYVSAGLAKVQRPSYAIALTVLYHVLDQVMIRLQATPEWSTMDKLRLFGVDPGTLSARSGERMPPLGRLEDLKGLITSGVRYEQLRGGSIADAEQALYGNSCLAFFEQHFIHAARQLLDRFDAAAEIKRSLAQGLSGQEGISFYALYKWCDEHTGGEVISAMRDRMRELTRAIEDVQEELERVYGMPADQLKFPRVPLMDKRNVRSFVVAFLDTVYGLRYEKLRLETELAVYRRYAAELESQNQWHRVRIERLQDLRTRLKNAAKGSIAQGDDYIGQNVFDYYERVTAEAIADLEERRGPGILFEERYVGDVAELLEGDEDELIERLIAVSRRDVLSTEPFRLSFEEELLQRANVSVSYSNRKVLPKEELFEQLYRMLEENAAIGIRLFDYTHKHRYEEQYLFGDRESEFVRYAFGMDGSSRIHKLGSLHESRRSGVEKLHLMGGFHVEDMIYYRNAKVFYDAYCADGYQFHTLEPTELPVMR